ncbi:hypothetical protein RhiirA1_532266 [Rhizophagus irregularis]|uniref:Uncharacterized protein n=1 Tax=Rhizophagus irregularis TaxID=588596 RepID=A0A2N0S635_9GLOM|nr:hypothetical protein RhiirA1_532266 [Rhizophagus irregularis]
MEPSVTYSTSQSVDYLGQIRKWSNTDIISSYKEICKQLDICQEKLREELEQKGRKKLRKSSSHFNQLSQETSQAAQQAQQSQRDDVATIGNFGNILEQQKEEPTLRAEEKHLIRMKNVLWRCMRPSVGCVGKGNKLASPKTSSQYLRKDILYSEQQETHSLSNVPRYNRSIKNRRIRRKIRRESTINPYTSYFMQLPRQNISNNPFANQIFNGINFC